MIITSDKLYKLSLIVLIVLASILIYTYMYAKPAVIEETKEHMNPALLTHQYEDLAAKPGDNAPINFYMKENRYATDKQYNPKLIDPLSELQSGIPCMQSNQVDWDVQTIPGANNTYGDLIWNTTSPKMVLEKGGCLSCKEYTGNQQYNEPSGIASELTSSLNGVSGIGALSDQDILNTHENLDYFVNK